MRPGIVTDSTCDIPQTLIEQHGIVAEDDRRQADRPAVLDKRSELNMCRNVLFADVPVWVIVFRVPVITLQVAGGMVRRKIFCSFKAVLNRQHMGAFGKSVRHVG